MIDFKGYIKFLKENKVFVGAVTFFIAGQLRILFERITYEIIIPFMKAENKKLKKVDFKEFLFLIIQLFITSYFFYKLYDNILEEI